MLIHYPSKLQASLNILFSTMSKNYEKGSMINCNYTTIHGWNEESCCIYFNELVLKISNPTS